MELNVGDYVRTKYGIIAKITDIIEDLSIDCDRDVYYENSLNDNMPMMEIPYNLKDEYIIKSSSDIIDLIEEKDLLKIEYFSLRYNKRVTRLFEVDYMDDKFMCIKNSYCDFMLVNKEFNENDKELNPIIKSVLTHEQFETMKYVVGEE